MKTSLKDRLLAKISADKNTGCWNWTAGKFWNGYGQIQVDRMPRGAHRVSYEVHRGSIPEGMFVLHCCDNPGCVNPEHLFLGTHAANMADMVFKGRQPRGLANGQTKLTAADVIAIRSANGRHHEIADRFGISRATVTHIRSGRRWAHMGVSK